VAFALALVVAVAASLALALITGRPYGVDWLKAGLLALAVGIYYGLRAHRRSQSQ
jgi:hypothetical protein